jgi:hypothetical protein
LGPPRPLRAAAGREAATTGAWLKPRVPPKSPGGGGGESGVHVSLLPSAALHKARPAYPAALSAREPGQAAAPACARGHFFFSAAAASTAAWHCGWCRCQSEARHAGVQ